MDGSVNPSQQAQETTVDYRELLDGSECHPVNPEPTASAFQRVERIEVTAPCDWLNSNKREHRMAIAGRTAQWRAAAKQASEGIRQFESQVHVEAHIYKPRRGRYDPNNLNITTKACVDGFVDSGVFVDDDWEHVIGPDHRHGGIGPARIIFLLTSLPRFTVLAR